MGMTPVRFNLQGVDQEIVDRTHAELRTGLRDFETPEGVRIPGAVWLVAATG
jgi:hypothetical protein